MKQENETNQLFRIQCLTYENFKWEEYSTEKSMKDATRPVSIPIIAITNHRAISLFSIHWKKKLTKYRKCRPNYVKGIQTNIGVTIIFLN